MKLINLNIYLNEKKIMLWNAAKKRVLIIFNVCFLFARGGLPSPQVG